MREWMNKDCRWVMADEDGRYPTNKEMLVTAAGMIGRVLLCGLMEGMLQ